MFSTGIGSAQENVREEPGSEVLPRDHGREESAGRDVGCAEGRALALG